MLVKFINILSLLLLFISCKAIKFSPVEATKTVRHRTMHTFTLPNQLEVLLISDPMVNKSAAALDVSVGNYADPEDQQGLAHYLEHMLFLGTRKYPKVGEYNTFLKKNMGYSNAYTSNINTNYYFEVNHDAYQESLDRFAQFFISPLFDEKYMEKEKNAVNSEYSKNIQRDIRREHRLLELMTKNGHPAKKFSTGSLETLKNVSRESILKFYNSYYSSDRMRLVLISQKDIDELKKLVQEKFSAIPIRETQSLEIQTEIFDSKDLPKIVRFVPVTQKNTLSLSFEIPYKEIDWSSKSSHILSSLLGHEGEGSYFSKLKKENLAYSISASTGNIGYKSLFQVNIELTEKGKEKIERVIEFFFSYVKMLNEGGYKSHLFYEDKNVLELAFKFRDLPEGGDAASHFASSMAIHPALLVEEREELLFEHSEKSVLNLLENYIIPEKLIALIGSSDQKTTNVEKFYGIQYAEEKISDSLIERLNDVKLSPDFHFPKVNELIPDPNIEIVKSENSSLGDLIAQSESSQTYFIKDHEFKQPKTFVNVLLFTTKFSENPRNYLKGILFKLIADKALEEWKYPYILAGLFPSLNVGPDAMVFSMAGPSDKISSKILKYIEKVKSVTIDESTFENIKMKFARDMENMDYSEAGQISIYELSELTQKPFIHKNLYMDLIKDMTLNDVMSFVEEDLFVELGVKTIVYGNEKKETWQNFSSDLLDSITEKGLPQDQWVKPKRNKIPAGKSFAYAMRSEVNNNNAWVSQICFGELSPENKILSWYARALMTSDFFNKMRTEAQLGYIVHSSNFSSFKSTGFTMLIQSGRYPPAFLSKHANEWLSNKIREISQMSDEQIEMYRAPILELLQERSVSMHEEVLKKVSAVTDYDGDFSYREKVITLLKRMPSQEIREKLVRKLKLMDGGQISLYFSSYKLDLPQPIKGEVVIKDKDIFIKELETY